MTSKEFAARLTAAGYPVAHARAARRGQEIRAYLYELRPGPLGTPHEVHWWAGDPDRVRLVGRGRGLGYRQVDVQLGYLPLPAQVPAPGTAAAQ
jgi:hypothetical protein